MVAGHFLLVGGLVAMTLKRWSFLTEFTRCSLDYYLSFASVWSLEERASISWPFRVRFDADLLRSLQGSVIWMPLCFS